MEGSRCYSYYTYSTLVKTECELNCHKKNNQNAIKVHNKENAKKNEDKKLFQFF
jgi:hypothetical protein